MRRKNFRSWRDYRNFRISVTRNQRFALEPTSVEFLRVLLRQVDERTRRIKEGQILWRAQLGHGWDPLQGSDGEWIDDAVPGPFPPDRMKPLRDSARQGRVNPPGVSYLYLAGDRRTAMMETRPWIGVMVSVGQFKTVRQLNIVDLSPDKSFKHEIFYFENPSPRVRNQAVLYDVCQAFSEPATSSDERADYVPTQIIADNIKAKGLDGVAYRSSLTEGGLNICLFDVDSARLCNCSLFEVGSIEMEFSEAANPYHIRDKDGAVLRNVVVDVFSSNSEDKGAGPANLPANDESIT